MSKIELHLTLDLFRSKEQFCYIGKMKFVIVFGPQAVGKMTVGHEIEKLTALKLFHNHMTIDLVNPFVSYGTDKGKELVQLLRNEVFKAVAASDSPGMIFTYLWDFESSTDTEYIKYISDLFTEKGAELYLVELEADIDTRLKRNRTEHRLKHKPTKRDFERSEGYILDADARTRNNSYENEIESQNYIRINNTELPPEEVAHRVVEEFNL